MTKKDMARAIAEELGVTQAQALAIVQGVLDGIVETLLTERRIELRNFGVFEIRRRRPRRARNPRTGERVSVPAKAVVTFKPGREMAERVAGLVEVPDKGQPAIGGTTTGGREAT
jgi:DNA-binding protein HU-beta/integration host factor subunit beta